MPAPPIRVLLIAPSLDILGGQAVQATRLMDGMRQVDSVRMKFLPINPRLPGLLRGLQQIRYVRTFSTWLLYLFKLLAAAARCDLLHIFSAGCSSYLLWSVPAIYVGRLYGKKIILNYRDGQCEDHLRNWKTAKPPLRLVHEIIAPTDFIVDVMAKFGFNARCIPNILDPDRFHYRRREKLRPIFMTNRILEPLYNVGCILRGFAVIQRRYPNATLAVAHDGVCRPGLERLARDLELRNVTFLGRVPHDRIPALYDEADIYLTTPNTDCMPGSLLECYASGLPIVATKAGGIPYILVDGQTGLLIPIDDHEALAEAAFRLLEDSELVARLTDNARRECERYRWVHIRDRWTGTYHRLLGWPWLPSAEPEGTPGAAC